MGIDSIYLMQEAVLSMMWASIVFINRIPVVEESKSVLS